MSVINWLSASSVPKPPKSILKCFSQLYLSGLPLVSLTVSNLGINDTMLSAMWETSFFPSHYTFLNFTYSFFCHSDIYQIRVSSVTALRCFFLLINIFLILCYLSLITTLDVFQWIFITLSIISLFSFILMCFRIQMLFLN